MEKTFKNSKMFKVITGIAASALVFVAAGSCLTSVSAIRADYPYDKTQNFDKSGSWWENHYRASSSFNSTHAYVSMYLGSFQKGQSTVRVSCTGFADSKGVYNHNGFVLGGWTEVNRVYSPGVYSSSMNLSTTRYSSSGNEQQDNYYTAK